jgi:cytochrome c2
VGSYLDAASAAVTSLGGHVLKKLGDGLMALFGYPQAQENDGERAVRAALAIQRALADLNARNAATGAPELAARIGLESGRVVVDPSGEVYGEAPNVAARVQSAAAPGEIWITRDVHRQIAGLFVAEDKGAHELKGVAEKTQLYRIVRARGETLYEACQDCHSLDKNDVGPRHRGVFGRKATSLPDYDYSDALKSTKIVWNEETLDKWLTDPQAVAPGAKMFFHLDNPQDRADVIAYLKERAK